MATHSNILAWKIPWIEKTGGLQSMGLQKVGHDWTMKKFSTKGSHLLIYKVQIINKTKSQKIDAFEFWCWR